METFINSSEDMQWLKDVHVRHLPDDARSAIIIGNDDAPESIRVYDKVDPLITDTPRYFYPPFIGMAAHIDYDPGDYLLIDNAGQIVAVSGNSDFDDIEGELPPVVLCETDYLIVKVLEVHTVDSAGNCHHKHWDYSNIHHSSCLGK